MLAKFIIIIFFLVILFNLFSGLKYLFSPKADSAVLLNKLKKRIVLSAVLFVLIVIGFLAGFVKLHTL